jgi:haloalkane dehalogenase
MMTITQDAASELFRAAPQQMLAMGPGKGEVAVRSVGTGPDVLFVHGWPMHGATFRKLLPHLVDHVTCHVIDLPGAGSSNYDSTTNLSIANHIHSVRRTVELLGLDKVAVVGHDSGGLIARHAMVGDERLRAMGLIDTEVSGSMPWRFRSFIAARHLPGVGKALGWLAGQERLRKNKFVFGDSVVDRSMLDGEFDEFFMQPLHASAAVQSATAKLFKSFDLNDIKTLRDVHRRIDVPVRLVWGAEDRFLPVVSARRMVGDFPDAGLSEISGAGLFSHEEKPAEVAAALLPTLTA